MALIDNKGKTLKQSLQNVLTHTDTVDIATAFFYFSGFEALAEELKDKKMRVLVGKAIDPDALEDLNAEIKENPNADLSNFLPRRESKLTRSGRKSNYQEGFIGLYNKSALSESFDSPEAQSAQHIFEEKLRNGSLEIRMSSDQNHSKVYMLKNKPEASQNGDYLGTVFMGSSNFTFNGLQGQGELNDVFRANQDFEKYSNWFEELWNSSEAIDIHTADTPDTPDSFLNQIQKRLWVHSTPEPYKIYVRILHELYASQELREVETPYSITGGKYKDLKYQLDAVQQGVEIIEQNDGVIIADVVGLGKSIIASAIAYNTGLTPIVIAPPHLMSQWEDYQREFKLPGATVQSLGKIEELHKKFSQDDEPKVFILDEAHRYRNELTDNYQWLHQLTRSHPDNKVLLLTATPYNNKPEDLFALIKLFQTPSRTTINSVDNLSVRFEELIARYKKVKNKSAKRITPELELELKAISKELRRLIEPVVIRRSRIDLKEIEEYAEDLKAQNIEFPEVIGPELIEYNLDTLEDLYVRTLETITDEDKGFKGTRYRSAAFIKDKEEFDKFYGDYFTDIDLAHAQNNLANFMRRLLVQRFESSKYAFQQTLDSMMRSHKTIIKWWEKGYVAIRKRDNLIDPEDLENFDKIEEINDQIELGEPVHLDELKKIALPIPKKFFEEDYIEEVKQDLQLLTEFKQEWFPSGDTGFDPKQEKIEEEITKLLEENPERKIVIFTSYADTASYVAEQLKANGLRTLMYRGGSSKKDKDVVAENFDASYSGVQKNDYDIVVATDALSEGFNLHRAGILFNYDIPYNPTRVVQRIGRINRINQKMFDEIFIYNFFPTEIGEGIARVKGISTLKMLLINSIVGSDTKTLTENEDLRSYFKRTYDEADIDSHDKSWDNKFKNHYNQIKNNHELIEEVLSIPERSRIVRENQKTAISVSFAKRGNGMLFATANPNDEEAMIVSPEDALHFFEAKPDEEPTKADADLDKKFEILRKRITAPFPKPKLHGNRGKALENVKGLRELYPAAKDYLSDLHDSIKEFDDLSDGELKFIRGLKFDADKLADLIEELKEKIPPHYLDAIRAKAQAVDSVSEVIMMTEDLRK